MNGFGHVARHGNEASDWTSGLDGAAVENLSDYLYQMDVPVDGRASLDSRNESREGTPKSGGLLVLLFLQSIFWFPKKNP